MIRVVIYVHASVWRFPLEAFKMSCIVRVHTILIVQRLHQLSDTSCDIIFVTDCRSVYKWTNCGINGYTLYCLQYNRPSYIHRSLHDRINDAASAPAGDETLTHDNAMNVLVELLDAENQSCILSLTLGVLLYYISSRDNYYDLYIQNQAIASQLVLHIGQKPAYRKQCQRIIIIVCKFCTRHLRSAHTYIHL